MSSPSTTPVLSQVMQGRLLLVCDLYDELALFLPPSAFASKLADLPSNTIGQQLWCVIGARESYVRALAANQWQGFRCSLSADQVTEPTAIQSALKNSAAAMRREFDRLPGLTDTQIRLAFELLEHEVLHQGQLVRYLYGLKLGVPQGWKQRYHLD